MNYIESPKFKRASGILAITVGTTGALLSGDGAPVSQNFDSQEVSQSSPDKNLSNMLGFARVALADSVAWCRTRVAVLAARKLGETTDTSVEGKKVRVFNAKNPNSFSILRVTSDQIADTADPNYRTKLTVNTTLELGSGIVEGQQDGWLDCNPCKPEDIRKATTIGMQWEGQGENTLYFKAVCDADQICDVSRILLDVTKVSPTSAPTPILTSTPVTVVTPTPDIPAAPGQPGITR